MPPDGRTFELGLVFAGTVSAGAYSAGALDFLLQALQELQNHRQDQGAPTHKVVIKAASGCAR